MFFILTLGGEPSVSHSNKIPEVSKDETQISTPSHRLLKDKNNAKQRGCKPAALTKFNEP